MIVLTLSGLSIQDEDHTDSNVSACAGLLGDLCTTFGASLLPIVEAHGVALSELLSEGRRYELVVM